MTVKKIQRHFPNIQTGATKQRKNGKKPGHITIQ